MATLIINKTVAMLRKFCLPVLVLVAVSAAAQFKNDNVLYKTVDPADLCATLDRNKGYILLDVRSKGEYDDTSSSPSYNLGHIKGARNMDIRELGQRLGEIKEYKDRPVFVYCSHSQRSRRAGKMLADSGFSNIYNINGGMTAIHYSGADQKGCLKTLVETKNTYAIISADELWSRTMKKIINDVFVLDVRSDSAFRHISLNAKENALGMIKGTVHIPLAELATKLSSVPKEGKQIVLTDMYGDEAAKAAVILNKSGYDKVSVLVEGIDRLLSTVGEGPARKTPFYQSPVSYELISVVQFGRLATSTNDFILLDIRTTDEFSNKHKDYWRNIGHIKNAINIPAADIRNRVA